MKIQKILLLIFLFCIAETFAQQGEPVTLNVIYQFKHVNDLNKPDKYYEEEMILRLGKTQSRYSSFTDELKAKTAVKVSGGQTKSSGSVRPSSGGGFGFTPTVFFQSKGVRDFDLLQNFLQSKLTRIIKLGDHNYLIEDALPVIDWKLYNEKKELAGYTCQKAVGKYAGRTYTVWFAPALPFNCGPWKLSGLPGLILQAKDSKNEVSFTVKELVKNDGPESTAARLSRIVKVNEKNFERARVAYEKDPVAYYQSQMPVGNTATANLVFLDSSGKFYAGEEGKKLFDAHKKDLKQQKPNLLELTRPN